jgi:hypothetical protein
VCSCALLLCCDGYGGLVRGMGNDGWTRRANCGPRAEFGMPIYILEDLA